MEPLDQRSFVEADALVHLPPQYQPSNKAPHLAAWGVEEGNVQPSQGLDSRGSQVHKALLGPHTLAAAVCEDLERAARSQAAGT